MIGSLRARLFLGSAVTTVAILAIFNVVLYTLIKNSVLSDFDESLMAKARAVSVLIEEGDGTYGLDYDAQFFPEFEANHHEFYEFWLLPVLEGEKPRVYCRSRSFDGREADLVDPPFTPGVIEAVLPDGRIGRVATHRFVPRRTDGDVSLSQRRELIVAVGSDTIEVMKTLAHLRWFLSGACMACLIASVGAIALVVRQLMKPIDHIANRIAKLSADDLSVRIAAWAIPSELRPVTERLDALLKRLHVVFAREKAFTANVAHELRTPLSGLRTTIEVTLSKARNPEIYQDAMQECLTICRQLQDLVDNLMSLSQLEAGRVNVTREPFDLSALLRESWKPYAEPVAARGIKTELNCGDNLIVDSDREHLRVVVRNLFDNAVSYCDANGAITCDAALRNDRCVLTVRNSGCALTADQLSQVFNRFWRADVSRSSKGMHCGIGLALCQKITELLGGTISVATENKAFIVTLSFPHNVTAHISNPRLAQAI